MGDSRDFASVSGMMGLPMIARLCGTLHRLQEDKAIIDVQSVGYLVTVGSDAWEGKNDGKEVTLWIYTYVREDRLDLFGFRTREQRAFFELLLQQSGIGPKVALELCAVPGELLLHALHQQDASLLGTVKGIGPKRAAKLLLELKSIAEAHPEVFGSAMRGDGVKQAQEYDEDAVAALQALGYDTPTIFAALKSTAGAAATTEERVSAALRSL